MVNLIIDRDSCVVDAGAEEQTASTQTAVHKKRLQVSAVRKLATHVAGCQQWLEGSGEPFALRLVVVKGKRCL